MGQADSISAVSMAFSFSEAAEGSSSDSTGDQSTWERFLLKFSTFFNEKSLRPEGETLGISFRLQTEGFIVVA